MEDPRIDAPPNSMDRYPWKCVFQKSSRILRDNECCDNVRVTIREAHGACILRIPLEGEVGILIEDDLWSTRRNLCQPRPEHFGYHDDVSGSDREARRFLQVKKESVVRHLSQTAPKMPASFCMKRCVSSMDTRRPSECRRLIAKPAAPEPLPFVDHECAVSVPPQDVDMSVDNTDPTRGCHIVWAKVEELSVRLHSR